MKIAVALLAALIVFECINIKSDVEPDYFMSIELFPSEHMIEGFLKVENISVEEIKGSIHPRLVIDSIVDENGREMRYERTSVETDEFNAIVSDWMLCFQKILEV